MGAYYITGGIPLSGRITVQGSKNAALPMMAASVLHEGVTILHNCPKISDVFVMERILQSVGAVTSWKKNTLKIDCVNVTDTEISREDAERMRSSVILMGSMLSRKQNVSIGFPGGCTIGERPIDLHLMVLKKMGAEITRISHETEAETLEGRTKGRLKGAQICFPVSSVGATEQALLAGVRAKGTTRMENCALEPEITHLCHFLQGMGAEIGGVGTRVLTVRGVGTLRDVEFTVPSDRIVAGTYLFGAAATRGRIVLEAAPIGEMEAVLRVYEKMGGQWEERDGKLVADASRARYPVSVKTDCYPGFPTDLQSSLMAALVTVEGESCIEERIFENRFKIVPELRKMGAVIDLQGRSAIIKGPGKLKGREVTASELRGGASLVLAGLAAEGVTVLHNPHYVQRGYEKLEQDIIRMGGKIKIKE